MMEEAFQKWLDEISLAALSNREVYADILDELKIAFAAGFNCKLQYNAKEYLQK